MIISYSRDQWLAMKMLKKAIADLTSSIMYMSGNNSEGQFTAALDKHKSALERSRQNFKYFLTSVPEREDTAAEAA